MGIIGAIYTFLIRMGMTKEQSIKNHPFNIRNSAILFNFGIHVTFNAMFLFYGAANLNEFLESIYFTAMAMLGTLNFSTVTWKMAEIYQFLENLEDTANSSKCHIAMKKYFFQFFPMLLCRTHKSNIGGHLQENQ